MVVQTYTDGPHGWNHVRRTMLEGPHSTDRGKTAYSPHNLARWSTDPTIWHRMQHSSIEYGLYQKVDMFHAMVQYSHCTDQSRWSID